MQAVPPWPLVNSVREVRYNVLWRVALEWSKEPEKFFPVHFDYDIIIDGARDVDKDRGSIPFKMVCRNGRFSQKGPEPDYVNFHPESDQTLLFFCNLFLDRCNSFLVKFCLVVRRENFIIQSISVRKKETFILLDDF